ncbi:MAG TPA: hypothetical protein VFW29_00275 [Solirubrobacteraceae bacterium]|nr:hypothetical protein [Solirubrobacteraceae bacterium]
MTPPNRIVGLVSALGVAAALAVPTAAGARTGDQTFQKTYPVASIVCAKFAAGKERPRQVPFAPQVAAACTALETEFNSAQMTVVAARTALQPQIAAAQAQVAAACPKPRAALIACRSARKVQDAQIRALVAQWHAAAHQFRGSLQTARTAFWTTIHSVPGYMTMANGQLHPQHQH